MPAKDGSPRAQNWKKMKRRRKDKGPRGPLRWSAHWLHFFLMRLFENLGDAHEVFSRFVQQPRQLRWGSACSGTESPAWVFAALASLSEDPAMTFDHIYGAEWEHKKREWILNEARPRFLFKDIFDVTRRRAFDYASQEYVDPKTACHEQPTDIFIAGFSCKTVSALSNDTDARRRSIDDYVGSTGLTFWGVIMILQMTKPLAFILENVEGLMRHSLHLVILERLRSLGYCVVWRLCDALEVGIPHHRPRIWFCGWLADKLPDVPAFQARMESAMLSLFDNHPKTDLDEFLLPEDHEVFFPDHDVRGKMGKKKIGTKWIEYQREKFAKQGLSQSTTHWRPELAETYPEYIALPERMRLMLDRRGIRFPEPSALVVRLDQSEAGIGRDQVPCVTPHGAYWAAHQCRLLTGWECMALQGFHLPEDYMQRYSSAFLQDLAGNAFNIGNCAVFVVLALLGLGDAQRERDVVDEPAAAVDRHFGFNPAVATDSEEEPPSDCDDADCDWPYRGEAYDPAD